MNQSGTTDILNYNQNNNISVYPIPSNGIFSIELNSTTSINITNVFGQTIFNAILEKGKQNIDIQNQPNGLYFLSTNDIAVKKIIKQ